MELQLIIFGNKNELNVYFFFEKKNELDFMYY